MALEPGPMQVVHNFFTTKSEVLADIDRLGDFDMLGLPRP